MVLSETCGDCVEAVTFFGIVQKLYCFFTSSQPRLNFLYDAQDELKMARKRLQRQCDTRWYCRYEAVKAVKQLYPALLLALENISKKVKCTDAKTEATGLINKKQKKIQANLKT